MFTQNELLPISTAVSWNQFEWPHRVAVELRPREFRVATVTDLRPVWGGGLELRDTRLSRPDQIRITRVVVIIHGHLQTREPCSTQTQRTQAKKMRQEIQNRIDIDKF